ncbi:hypothetical protein AB0284_10750 [Pseudarthrobacter phenanthrenivorans]|uniref:hypothetical protein n=1 Tax=Pseudarthrobacter phenanthrenivorans TaxID=361575 RepID=UPI00344F4DEA
MEPAARADDGGTSGRAYLAGWVGWVTLGESLGFLAPALAQFVAATFLPDALFGLLVVAGLAEGGILGWFQARILRVRLPGLSTERWTVLTGLAAGVAWSVGMLPSTFAGWQDWPPAARIGAGTLAAVVLLGSIGTAQWLELRRLERQHLISRAWRWIAGSAAAWAAGLAVFTLVAPPLWQPGQPAWLVAVIGVAAAVLMAAAMALVTGLVLLRVVLEAAPEARRG